MSKSLLRRIDFALLTPVIVLSVFSLATLFSVDTNFFKAQLFYLILSLFVFLVVSNLNFQILQQYALYLYLGSILLLAFVLLVGIETRGAVRWLDIVGLKIQFSEVFKPFLAIALSALLAKRTKSLKDFLFCLFLTFPVVLLIAFQPDLGNALIYFTVSLLTLVVFGFPYIFFLFGILVTSVAFPLFWRLMHDYQRQRLLTFINPSSDPLGTSYNAIQSIIAVGAGGLLGRGLGEGTQSILRFLPERHTDFIFATLSEEFGFLGAGIVMACFAFLLYRIFQIILSAEDTAVKIFGVCSFFLILMQFFANVGMNLGLIPIVGVTLPFVSYGGSSLLSNFILLGLLSGLSKESGQVNTLEIR